MVESTDAGPARVNSSAGHLSVHFEGYHPVEVPFLFEQPEKRIAPAFLGSLASHAAMLLVALLVVRYGNQAGHTLAVLPENPNTNIIWLSQPGPGGGGGGGGNKMKEPPRKAEDPGRDKVTIPVQKPPRPELHAKVEPNPLDQLFIPAKNLASATESLPGAITTLPGPPTLSQGSGSGGGTGTGTGTGIGPGMGSGLGPGSGGGSGGGVYRLGSGVSEPIKIREVKPSYTSEAMRAKVQGIAWVTCVVRTNGAPDGCHIARSLDPTFGLDQEAVKAAQGWRFIPGKLKGEAVDVEITIQMEFTLR